MKYTTKIKQAQFIGKIKIEPKGGDLSNEAVKSILADKWGQELIQKGMLNIDGVSAKDLESDDGKKESPVVKETPKQESFPSTTVTVNDKGK